jgi:peptidoglycan biosynthesis protein MviN/MurJ (putative lipid II flippase)
MANLALNALLDHLLYAKHGLGGIALATSVVHIASYVMLALIVRRIIGRGHSLRTLSVGIRSVLAAAIVSAGGWIAIHQADGLWGDSILTRVVIPLAVVAIMTALYRLLLRVQRLDSRIRHPLVSAEA